MASDRRRAANVTHYRHPSVQGTPAACGMVPVLSTPAPWLTDCAACLEALFAQMTEIADPFALRERTTDE